MDGEVKVVGSADDGGQLDRAEMPAVVGVIAVVAEDEAVVRGVGD